MPSATVTKEEVTKLLKMLKYIRGHCDEVRSRLSKVAERVKEEGFSTEKGVSFLEVRHYMLTSKFMYIYIIDIIV